MEISNLIKKQEEKLTNIILYLNESDRKDSCGNYKDNAVIDYGRLKSFIAKVRKEIVEAVLDEVENQLKGYGIQTPRAECLVLDRHTFKVILEEEIKKELL